VIGEGAGTLVLEALEHAEKRGATPIAELVGFATNGDGRHIVQPTREDMTRVMCAALQDAQLGPEAIDAVSMHGTATDIGDVAESWATYDVFGSDTPVYTLKSYMGHTLGACGALEAWAGLHLMQEQWLPGNLNLEEVDPECAPLQYTRATTPREQRYLMSNNFAFGGVNTSLIFKLW
jgi:3-oxoacyl-[acyl-carrier-protein] synthase II